MPSKKPPPSPASAPAPLPHAGLWLRVGAKLIDHGLWAFVETACIGLGAYLNAVGRPPWVIAGGWVVAAVLWYVYVFEFTRRRGQTPGKMLARIRVVSATGGHPGSLALIRRTAAEAFFDLLGIPLMVVGWALARSVGVSPATGALVGTGLGFVIGAANPLWILRSQQRQALHDVIAGTLVIRTGQARGRWFVAVAVLCAGLPEATVFGIVRPLFVEAYFVPSGSMEPTIQIGDRILANKLLPRLRPPRRGEIVMFRAPKWADEKEKVFVKRVVGTAGDRLQVRGGKLFRNGEPVAEPYLKETPDYTWPPGADRGEEVVVPDGNVVVLGDNRRNSHDSHRWERISPDGRVTEPAPFLPVDRIRGRLVYRYWPPDRMGTVAQEP